MKQSRSNRTVRLVGAFLLAAGVFTACDQGTVGIFATIEAEEKITTRNLVDNASITGLVLANLGGTERYFALANNKVFQREKSGVDWSAIENPGGYLGQFIAGVNTSSEPSGDPVIDEEVYAVFADVNSDDYRIYALQSDLTWATTPTYNPSDVSITGMLGWDRASDGASGVVISQSAAGERTFYSWSGAVSGTPGATHAKGASVLTNGDDLRDIATTVNETTAGAGGVAGEIAFLIGRQGGSFYLPASALGASDTAYEALLFDAAADPDVYFTSQRGVGVRGGDGTADDIVVLVDESDNISVSDDNGATWQRIDSATGRSYTDILWVPQIGDSGAFVVGTETRELENTVRRGYYHAFLTGSSGDYGFSMSNDLGNNYDGSDLAVSAIDSFRLFDSNQLFALTYGLGLWSTRYTEGSTTPIWTWE